MNAYKIIVAYDGTDYYGWQEQRDAVSVAGCMQERFKKLFGHDIQLVGASRTDGGVHALGQVARFYSPLSIESERFRNAWNAKLPADIHIRQLLPVVDFHPQHNVIQKTYQYYVSPQRPLPFISRYVMWHRPFDVDKLAQALQYFVGEHDFRSFCTGTDYENTIRRVDSIECRYIKRYNVFQIEVRGPGFLRYMIRRMVGSALYVASYPNRNIEVIDQILKQKNPAHHLPTAPSYGLVLRSITYRDQL